MTAIGRLAKWGAQQEAQGIEMRHTFEILVNGLGYQLVTLVNTFVSHEKKTKFFDDLTAAMKHNLNSQMSETPLRDLNESDG